MHARGVGDGGEVADGAEVSLAPLDHLDDVRDVEASVQPAKHARLAIDGDRRHVAALGDEVAQDTGAVIRDEGVGRGAVGARKQLRHGRQGDDGKGAAVADHVVAFGQGNIPAGRQRAGRRGDLTVLTAQAQGGQHRPEGRVAELDRVAQRHRPLRELMRRRHRAVRGRARWRRPRRKARGESRGRRPGGRQPQRGWAKKLPGRAGRKRKLGRPRA